MTIPTVPCPQPGELLSRVRAWTVSSWGHGNRVGDTRLALDRLALLATAGDGIGRPAVPEAGVHALADQLDVLITDAVGAGASQEVVRVVLADLSADLGLG